MSERLVRGARRCGETFYHFTDEAKALLSVQSGRDYNRSFRRDILLRWYRVVQIPSEAERVVPLRLRSAGKVVSLPVLGVVGGLPDGRKHLLALELCGGESLAAWKGCLDDLVARGLRAPVLAIIDGNAGLRRAVGEIWPRTYSAWNTGSPPSCGVSVRCDRPASPPSRLSSSRS